MLVSLRQFLDRRIHIFQALNIEERKFGADALFDWLRIAFAHAKPKKTPQAPPEENNEIRDQRSNAAMRGSKKNDSRSLQKKPQREPRSPIMMNDNGTVL